MTGRILWLDNLKGVLIFLVVLGHCIQFTSQDPDSDRLYNFIYSFHMPLFMFLSGYACYKSDISFNIISRRFVQLIIPFVSYNAINALLTGNNYSLYFKYPQVGLWFLWVLFFITMLQVVASNISRVFKLNEEFITFCTFVIIFVVSKILHITIFAFDMIASFWLYYALGFFARKHNNIIRKKHNKILVISLLIGSLILSMTYNRVVVPHFISFVPHIVYIRLVPIFCIISLVTVFYNYINSKLLIFNKIGGGYARCICNSFTVFYNHRITQY
jgi:fucose 4-O-acetylase-like acetyltransferase